MRFPISLPLCTPEPICIVNDVVFLFAPALLHRDRPPGHLFQRFVSQVVQGLGYGIHNRHAFPSGMQPVRRRNRSAKGARPRAGVAEPTKRGYTVAHGSSTAWSLSTSSGSFHPPGVH